MHEWKNKALASEITSRNDAWHLMRFCPWKEFLPLFKTPNHITHAFIVQNTKQYTYSSTAWGGNIKVNTCLLDPKSTAPESKQTQTWLFVPNPVGFYVTGKNRLLALKILQFEATWVTFLCYHKYTVECNIQHMFEALELHTATTLDAFKHIQHPFLSEELQLFLSINSLVSSRDLNLSIITEHFFIST